MRAARFRSFLALAATALVCAVPACRRGDEGTRSERGAERERRRAKPKERALGIELPESIRITRRFQDAVYLTSRLSLEKVANFFRDRLLAENVEVGAGRTLFPSATLKGGDPKKLIRAELTRTRLGTQIKLEDVTPPPAMPGLSEAESLRRVGRNPDGTVANLLERR